MPKSLAPSLRARCGCPHAIDQEEQESHRQRAERLKDQAPMLVDTGVDAGSWHTNGKVEEREGVETADHGIVDVRENHVVEGPGGGSQDLVT